MKVCLKIILFIAAFTTGFNIQAQSKIKFEHALTYELMGGVQEISFLSDDSGDVLFFEKLPAGIEYPKMEVEHILLNLKEKSFILFGEKENSFTQETGDLDELIGLLFREIPFNGDEEELVMQSEELMDSDDDSFLGYSIYPETEQDDPLEIHLNTSSNFKSDQFIETAFRMLKLPADVNLDFKEGHIIKLYTPKEGLTLAELTDYEAVKKKLSITKTGIEVKGE